MCGLDRRNHIASTGNILKESRVTRVWYAFARRENKQWEFFGPRSDRSALMCVSQKLL